MCYLRFLEPGLQRRGGLCCLFPRGIRSRSDSMGLVSRCQACRALRKEVSIIVRQKLCACIAHPMSPRGFFAQTHRMVSPKCTPAATRNVTLCRLLQLDRRYRA
eukprot:UN1477